MEPKPLFPKQYKKEPTGLTVGSFFKSVPTNTKTSQPKALFPDKAISENIVDPVYANDPMCNGLSPKDIGRVKHIVEAATPEATTYVLEYADDLRTRFAALINDVINHRTGPTMVNINNSISALLQIIQQSKTHLAVLLDHPVDAPWYLFKKEPKVELSQIIKTFNDQLKEVDSLVSSLNGFIDAIVTEVTMLDTMYKNNRDQFDFLNLHIVAGKIIINNYNNRTIPKRKASAAGDIFKMQDVAYLVDCIDRFDRKIVELEKLAQSVLLTGPQIRLDQSNSKDIAEQIKQLTLTIVPMWKNQFKTVVGTLSNPQIKSIDDVLTCVNSSSIKSAIQDASRANDKFAGILSKSPNS